MKKLSFKQLPQGGFAGLLERRFVINQTVFGRSDTIAFGGLGNFVYLADANFLPLGETKLHSHKNIDVISIMVSGEIEHHGSLASGQVLSAGMAQVQRAGHEGFSHNEVNPNSAQNHMLQLWVIPEQPDKTASYQTYHPQPGELTFIYGTEQTQTLQSDIRISIANFVPAQVVTIEDEALVYISQGEATINNESIAERTLVQDKKIAFTAKTHGQAIFISRPLKDK